MFFVVNKEKLYAYFVSVFTVAMLFAVAGMLMPKENTMETSANVTKNIVTQNIDKDNINKISE